MRSFNLLIMSLLLVVTYSGFAQKSEKKSAAETKAADERKRSFGGYRTPLEPSHTPDRNTQLEKREAEPLPSSENSLVVTPNKDQPKNKIDNAPTVIQAATSESGSPAILSENNGKGRDGTGNVQRSSYNIAGAKIPGEMNAKNVRSQKNMNAGAPRARKQEEQPPRIISRNEQTVKPKTVLHTEKSKSKERSRKSRKGKVRTSGK